MQTQRYTEPKPPSNQGDERFDYCAAPGCDIIVGNRNYPAAPGQRCSRCLGPTRTLKPKDPNPTKRPKVFIEDSGPLYGAFAFLVGPNPNGIGVLVELEDKRVVTAVVVSPYS